MGDHLVVIGGRRDRLHVLNPVARLIHEARCAGTQPKDIAQTLSNLYGIPQSAALRDVNAALDQWRDLGIARQEAPGIDPEAQQPAAELPSAPEPAHRADYQIADQAFTVRYGSEELYEAIHGLLAHLGKGAPDSNRKVLDAWEEDGFFYVLNEGQLRQKSESLDQAVMGVVREVAELAYRGRDWLTICHACAIRDGTHCIVLPAASGSGKSTLAAALYFKGWTVFADDVVPVDRHTHEAIAVPIPFNLKSASLPVLSVLKPGIERTPGFDRGDRAIHYLVPQAFAEASPAVGYPVRLLVYPRYVAGERTVLRPLDHAASLQKLIESDCMLPLPLEDDLVEELVAWISGLPAFELIYSDLDEASAALAGVMAA